MELTTRNFYLSKFMSFVIVWNVGQGQWITFVTADHCQHFDVGGELWPLVRLEKICGHLKNEIYISHWDEDHINGLAAFQNRKEKLCHGPLPDFPPPKKYSWIHRVPRCPNKNEIQTFRPLWSDKELKKKRVKNESSLIRLRDKILMPGDSPINMEKKWALDLKSNVDVLILGHHGAKNSTSELLLRKLDKVKLAISSAREKRYGHPSPEVRSRLRRNGIPLLRTEDWGNIIFQ